MVNILDQYKEYLLARKKSLNYYNIMKIFIDYLKDHDVQYREITQEVITNFFNANESYSINTRNQYIKAGRSFYRFLNIEDDKNVWYKIKLLPTERKIPDYFTENDLREAKKYLITYHGKKFPSVKINALLDFLFYSGIRKAELLGLKREDIRLEDNSAKVYGKGKKERIIYYPALVKKELKDYFEYEPQSNNAFNITIGQINYISRLLKKYFPNKKVTIHLFRHSGAREMIKKGIPIGVVSKILGHSSLTTTMIYTDPDEKMIEEIYKNKMNER